MNAVNACVEYAYSTYILHAYIHKWIMVDEGYDYYHHDYKHFLQIQLYLFNFECVQ